MSNNYLYDLFINDLKKLSQNGGSMSGGGSGGGVSSWNEWREIANTEVTSKLDEQFGVFCAAVYWDTLMALKSVPETISIEYDGVLYESLKATNLPGFGDVVGNLSFANAMLGTSFPNTGEPFICGVFRTYLYFMTMDSEPTAHTVKASTYCKPFTLFPIIDLTKYINRIERRKEYEISGNNYAENVYWKLKQNDTVMLRMRIESDVYSDLIVCHPIQHDYGNVHVSCLGTGSQTVISLDATEEKAKIYVEM